MRYCFILVNYSRQLDRSSIYVVMFPKRTNLDDQNHFGINQLVLKCKNGSKIIIVDFLENDDFFKNYVEFRHYKS